MVFQFALTFVGKYLFTKEIEARLNLMERSMIEDGVPPNQSRHVSWTARGFESAVSSYVQNTAMQIIGLNCAMTVLIFFYLKKEPDSQ
jgi:hypothetical protein